MLANKLWLTIDCMYACVRIWVCVWMSGCTHSQDEDPLPLPLFIHSDDVVYTAGGADLHLQRVHFSSVFFVLFCGSRDRAPNFRGLNRLMQMHCLCSVSIQCCTLALLSFRRATAQTALARTLSSDSLTEGVNHWTAHLIASSSIFFVGDDENNMSHTKGVKLLCDNDDDDFRNSHFSDETPHSERKTSKI